MALELAKQQNKEYTVYNTDNTLKSSQYNNIIITQMIKKALQENNILVYFQPIVNKHGTIIKYESLIRIQNDSEIISPYYFIEISKKTKYYSQLTKKVIERSFEVFKDRKEQFSINLSVQDIINDDIVLFIYNELATIKEPQRVVFEILESENIYGMEAVKLFIKNIQQLGAKIAIDDFGTGYSNFSYLLDIQPNYLKIDGSLIKNIDTDKKSQRLVNVIVNFAHSFDMIVVAEFVHSQSVFNYCKSLNIDEFQGYYFGKPQENLLTDT